jgi:cytochrome P450
MSFLAYHLAIHPEDRHRVAGNPEIVPQAVEELLRRYGIPTVSRTLARDFELGGVQMKEGDNIMIPIMLSGLDERSWRSPMQTDFDRDTRGQIGFGKGVHHCPGTHLARAELRIFLEEWLKRIPNFSLDPDRPPVFTSGYLAGVLSLPLVWDPASVA